MKMVRDSEFAPCQVCGIRRRVRTNRNNDTCQVCRNNYRHQLKSETWMNGAACSAEAYDPNWWTGDETFEEYALWVCNKVCPVRDQCLAWALDNNETHNIYGGKTPLQRGVIARDNRRALATA